MSQSPDLGNEFNHPGNAANKENGSAIANENPSMPIIGAKPPSDENSPIMLPSNGLVQENETMARARAIKKKPTQPPLCAFLSILFAHEFGSMISKAPKKDAAKTNNTKKEYYVEPYVGGQGIQ